MDKEELPEESLQSFQPKQIESMNRAERRSRIKFYDKMLKGHVKRKPSSNIHETDPAKQQSRVDDIQRWSIRYEILKRKLEELGA